MTKELMPGDRVLAFDPRLYINDVKTPSHITWKPAVIVSRYGYKTEARPDWPERIYEDLVDLAFEYCPDKISRGHFTDGVNVIEYCGQR